MPTYGYRCPSGHEFDHFYRKMSESEQTLPCPTCGLVAERQMSGGAGLVFKGSGFYITDYGKDGKKDQRKNDGKSSVSKSADSKSADSKSSDSKSGDSGSSDSKPAESKPASDTGARAANKSGSTSKE